MNIADRSAQLAPGIDLARTIGSLTAAGSKADVIRIVKANTRRFMAADGIAIILLDGKYCHYVEEDAETPLWKGQRIMISKCPAGRSMTSSETVIIEDVNGGEGSRTSAYEGTFVKSAIIVPVFDGEDAAAIGVYWSEARRPTPSDVAAAETLGHAVSASLSKLRQLADYSDRVSELEFERDEIKHRLKNAYATAIGLAGLALPPEYASHYSGRLTALAAVHDLLDTKSTESQPASLGELLAAVLSPYQTSLNRPISLVGPYLPVSAAHATAIGLVANELATNAMKHGSLSRVTGKVVAGWTVSEGEIHFSWRETEGPLVNTAATANQGSKLLRRLVEGQLKGRIDHLLTPGGLEVNARLPITA